jgi:hypothetical protein
MTARTTSVPFVPRPSHPAGPRVAPFTMDCRWIDGDPSVLLAAVA